MLQPVDIQMLLERGKAFDFRRVQKIGNARKISAFVFGVERELPGICFMQSARTDTSLLM